jgi:predicted ArsR family transcriptional regulator
MTEMSAATRDKLIVELRRKGRTYAEIGKAVGLSKMGVRYALIRIAQGREGRAPR